MPTQLALQAGPVPLPAPRRPVAVRAGTAGDLPFIDALQRKQSKQVGFMPTAQLEGKIAAGHVLVAEAGEVTGHLSLVTRGRPPEGEGPASDKGQVTNDNLVGQVTSDTRLGYLIAADRYFKHDDVGIIYQMNVVPEARRSLVAATLLAAQFDRSAYGCKLYCCWCAQDLAEANRFWEAIGFVPLAFRAGSEKKGRVHIFWQRRVRAGDATTPWWFPSQTTGGSLRADRLVLPIPPGARWDDPMPVILPGAPDGPQLEGPGPTPEGRTAKRTRNAKPAAAPPPPPTTTRVDIARCGLRIGPPAPAAPAAVEKPKREPKPRAKTDPKLIAAARELRDRWLERVNTQELLPQGKYDVSRAIGCAAGGAGAENLILPDAPPARVARRLPAPRAADARAA